MSTCEKNVILINEDGLHARPAGILAKAAGQFTSKIEISSNGITKNAKSIMSIMSMGLKTGDSILIKADGDDSNAALECLINLFNNKFED